LAKNPHFTHCPHGDARKQKIEIIAQKAQSTYVIANNHYQAKAPVNALELRHMLETKKSAPQKRW
jgi:uncharacterized protein YecE (DUF72 family)